MGKIVDLSAQDLEGAQPVAQPAGIDLSPEDLAGAVSVADPDKQARIKRETEAGQIAPPSFFSKLRAAAFGDTEVQGPAPPPSEHPGFKPTTDENAEFEQLPWYRKAGRVLTGNLPEANAADRGLRHELAADPGKRGVMQLEGVGRNLAQIPFVGPAAGRLEAGLTAAAPAVRSAVPYVADAVAGAGTAALEGMSAGQSPRDIAHDAVSAVAPSVALGKFLRVAGPGSGRGADAIRDSKTTTGADLRVLERAGYEPSPVPTRPVTRIEQEPSDFVGPRQAPSPSKAMGVQATSEGRGMVGTRGAEVLKDELDVQKRMGAERTAAAARRYNRPGGQGHREISVEPLLAQTAAEGQSITSQMQPGVQAGMKRLQGMLQGRVEPTAEIYGDTGAHPYQTRPGVRDVEINELDPRWGTHSRVPYDSRPEPGRPASRLGEVTTPQPESPGPMFSGDGSGPMFQPPTGPQQEVFTPLHRRIQSIPPETYATAGGEPPRQIGVGDVHGRMEGEDLGHGLGPAQPPQHIRTANELNQIRDQLDEAGNVAAKEGLTKGELPYARLAHTIRNDVIPKHAPEIATANRRAHARMNRRENAEELMKDAGNPAPESLGMQLAGQGEEGSKVAGARQDRLDRLRAEFPISNRMSREDVGRAMDNPRLLLAEERMQFKKLPRIGGGGTDMLNLSEPLVARGVYPALRGVERGAEGARRYAPGLLQALQRAREEEKRRAAAR